LNFRNRGNLEVQGDVKVNGTPITSPLQLAAISGYVQQDDLVYFFTNQSFNLKINLL
jgi:hypothetical protein